MRIVSIKTIQGIVKGSTHKLPNGESFLKFSGIPYAKRPIEKLRFFAPKKLDVFDYDVLDCTKEGNHCFQRSMFTKKLFGSEDCLYLNVYTPEIKRGEKYAVMVFIHGGGFCLGSSSIQWYSPVYLLMEDVIVVTINYRLHALGFASLPSMGISGNAGLKDQQMALEWVYENISNFNGDPENICLFGESAGAASVHLHVLNIKSRKFIKSAICQSGCALTDWTIQYDASENTKRLAKLLGCSNTNDDKKIYKTIMNSPMRQLLECSEKIASTDGTRISKKYVFTPSIELESEDSFLLNEPVHLIKDEIIDIPIVFGTTNRDGMLQSATKLPVYLEALNNNPVQMIPTSLNIDINSTEAVTLANEIKRFYFKDKKLGVDVIENYFDLMTDTNFLLAQTISSELHALHQQNSKQFLYEFQFDGELNLFKEMLGLENYRGASHIDDIFYVFGHENFKPNLRENSPALKIKFIMCKLWTNFAKYQDPTPKIIKPYDLKWESIEHNKNVAGSIDLKYLVIDEKLSMQRNLNYDRMNFWRNIYKKFNNSYQL